jgi:hypothetical protein
VAVSLLQEVAVVESTYLSYCHGRSGYSHGPYGYNTNRSEDGLALCHHSGNVGDSNRSMECGAYFLSTTDIRGHDASVCRSKE